MVPGHPANLRQTDQIPQQLEDGTYTGDPEKQHKARTIQLEDPVKDLSQPQRAQLNVHGNHLGLKVTCRKRIDGLWSTAGSGVPLVTGSSFGKLLQVVAGEGLGAAQLARNQADVSEMFHCFHAHE